MLEVVGEPISNQTRIEKMKSFTMFGKACRHKHSKSRLPSLGSPGRPKQEASGSEARNAAATRAELCRCCASVY